MIFNNKKYNIPKITIGCESLGGTDWGNKDIKELTNVLNHAYENDYNCFDTADVYGLGESEERIGKIFKNKINDVFIITKFGIRWHTKEKNNRASTYKDLSINYMIEALENSLRRLRIGAIPLYLIHWPDSQFEIEPVIDAMKKQKEKGKIINFGISNFTLKDIPSNLLNEIDAICNSFNLLDPISSKEILSKGKKLDKSIFIYGTLAQGLLTGNYRLDTNFTSNDRRSRLPHFQSKNNKTLVAIINKIIEIGKINRESSAQVVHKWIVSKNISDSSIMGFSNIRQLNELISANKTKLDSNFIEELDYLSNKYIKDIESIRNI